MGKINRHKGILIITLLYFSTFLFMLPLRNQTFQDDWAYVQSVNNFLHTGILKVSEWSSATLIFPIYWGSIFSKIFGYSIKSLHLSTITILYIGSVAFYLLLRKLKIDEIKSIFFTIVLFSFPWVFNFSYTFLTDVPFMSLSIICMYFYVAAIQTDKKSLYLLGGLFAGLAFLTRQLGIVFPISILLIQINKDIANKKFSLGNYIFFLTPFLIIIGLYLRWMNSNQNLTNAQYQSSKQFFDHVLPYLLPTNISKVGATYSYYLTFVQRIIIYFHLCIGFLLPVFLVFKINFKSIKKSLTKNKFSILTISLTYLSFMAFEVFQHYARRVFILEIPTLVTRYNVISTIDFNILWKYLVGISIVLWIPLIAIIFQRILGIFFRPRKMPKIKLAIIMTLSVIVEIIYYEFLLFQDAFKDTIPKVLYNNPLKILDIYLQNIKTPLGNIIIQNSLVILLVFSIIGLSATFLIAFFKLKTKRKIQQPELGFILLSFLGIFSILVIYMYFYWHQYIISIIPFFIIALANISKNWKVNKTMIFLIGAVLIIFSVSLTKNRYETPGIIWEMSNQLVNIGIKPININGSDESWIPYWYFEKTRDAAVKDQFGGNKYLITPGQWATWRNIKTDSTCVRDFLEVNKNYKFIPEKNKKLLLDITTNYTILTQKRYIAVESGCK